MKKRWLFLPLLLALAAGGYWFFNVPETAVPSGAQSAARLAPGPFAIQDEAFEATDAHRGQQAYHDYAGASARTLAGELWRPAGLAQPGPLVIYSHGFMSFHREGVYLARFLASHGYTVLAVDYPLTGYGAPDGPLMRDVVNQPGDISFLIDTLLARNADPADPLHDTLDPARIAVAGTSLGGLTSMLTAFHRRLRDPRIAAAISLAGPASMLSADFFTTSEIPLLVIFGDADVIVPYPANAATIVQKHPGTVLVTLKDASHAGFAQPAATLMRFMANPDVLGCRAVLGALQGQLDDQRNTLLTVLGGQEDGIDPGVRIELCTDTPIAVAMPPARQQMFTTLAVYAFLESVFAPEATARDSARDYLLQVLPQENSGEVTVAR